MKINKEDNSIYIGNKNKIKNNIIGNDIKLPYIKEPWYSKLFWKIFIPIIITVFATAICLWLGLK